jgi:hypothetical protein
MPVFVTCSIVLCIPLSMTKFDAFAAGLDFDAEPKPEDTVEADTPGDMFEKDDGIRHDTIEESSQSLSSTSKPIQLNSWIPAGVLCWAKCLGNSGITEGLAAIVHDPPTVAPVPRAAASASAVNTIASTKYKNRRSALQASLQPFRCSVTLCYLPSSILKILDMEHGEDYCAWAQPQLLLFSSSQNSRAMAHSSRMQRQAVRSELRRKEIRRGVPRMGLRCLRTLNRGRGATTTDMDPKSRSQRSGGSPTASISLACFIPCSSRTEISSVSARWTGGEERKRRRHDKQQRLRQVQRDRKKDVWRMRFALP